MKRNEILETASNLISGDREADYGSAKDNFELIAKLWNVHLGFEKGVTAHDVGIMMALLKIARISTGGAKADNYIDCAGYVALAGELSGGNDK